MLRAVGQGGVLRLGAAGDVVRLPLDDAVALRDDVRRLVVSRVAEPADADDIVQDVVERVLRRRHQLRDPERGDVWLAQIVRNAVADHYRRQRRADVTDSETFDRVPAYDEAPRLPSSQLAPCVASFVDTLPSTYAEALRLTDLGPHTQEQAAATLGVSTSGMKSRVQRGRRLLEAELRGCCDVERDTRGAITEVAPRARSRCGATAPCIEDLRR